MKGIVIDKTPYDYFVELPDGSIFNTIGNTSSKVGENITTEYFPSTSPSSHIKFNNNFDYF